MFKTARFKVHNPSRHKATMLKYALTHYHETLKKALGEVLSEPDLLAQISVPDKKGRARVSFYSACALVRRHSPKEWVLAPIREYLILDATAMLLSHFKKQEKGKHESNPPTLPNLTPLTDEQVREAHKEFANTVDFPLKPQQLDKIEGLRAKGQTNVALRVENIYKNWAASRAAGEVMRKQEGAQPRPIEFTHTDFERGCLLARKGGNYYALVRLFRQGHRYRDEKVLEDGFVDWKTREVIGGRKYPGLILPLELGREYHEHEFLEMGRPRSAKLFARRNEAGREDYYLHISFEFTPVAISTETVLGIDRGAAKIGAGTVVDQVGSVVTRGIDLEGTSFSAEMARQRKLIAELQRTGKQHGRRLRVRGRKSDIIIGEYANRVVALAAQNQSQIAIEKIDAISMARFLTQSQFTKLKAALSYKAERLGLPAPIEVPAAYSSQTCARCGHKARENRPRRDATGRAIQDVFHCVECGYQANADDNASEVIALRGLHQQLQGGKFQKFNLFQL